MAGQISDKVIPLMPSKQYNPIQQNKLINKTN